MSGAPGLVLASFAACVGCFLLLGIASFARSRGTCADYYLASRSVSPALVGLSAVATNNSGYMFIGVIGYTYASGLAAVWLMVGWILGDLLASFAVHRQLRLATERTRELTFVGVLAHWSAGDQRRLRVVAALFTLVFLGAYAAAQIAAGSKALDALFGWGREAGALLTASMVVAYCLAGGIRASIWTDAAQAFVMLLAMAVLLVAAVAGLGGAAASWQRLQHIPDFMSWFPDDLLVPGVAGMGLFAVGWLFAGLSVIGQPHVMVRFMALDDPAGLARARLWYYTFFVAFYAMATAVGLLSRVYLPELATLDPELALPEMAELLLPPALVGLLLAGIFAATMSTADSLVLSCSAAITQDLRRHPASSLLHARLATLGVTACALAVAVSETRSVFDLVVLSWSTLASAFAPLLIVHALGNRPTQTQALAMLAAGVLVAWGWRMVGLADRVYEGMPGILCGLATYYLMAAAATTRRTSLLTRATPIPPSDAAGPRLRT